MEPGVARHPSSAASVSGVERADDDFFAAIVTADPRQLSELVAEEFLIVEVVGGSVVDRDSFIRTVASGVVRFENVTVVERATRRYGDTAVVVGRTQMRGDLDGAAFAAASRYTHVFRRARSGAWRLVNAQGTQIIEKPPSEREAA